MEADPSTDPPLSTAVRALCDELPAELSPDLSGRCGPSAAHLGHPLRVALGGGISAGKSTLVNALRGRRVAEVQPATTRRVTTVYRAAVERAPESVTLQLTNGDTYRLVQRRQLVHHVQHRLNLPQALRGPLRGVEAGVGAHGLDRCPLVRWPGE